MREEVVAGSASFEHSRISCNDDNQWGQSITNAASLPKVHKVILIVMLSSLLHFLSNQNGNILYYAGYKGLLQSTTSWLKHLHICQTPAAPNFCNSSGRKPGHGTRWCPCQKAITGMSSALCVPVPVPPATEFGRPGRRNVGFVPNSSPPAPPPAPFFMPKS